ncbi:type I restriction endonuclease [Novosphingobium panipatense]
MSIHKEVRFEDEICSHLAEHGWLHEPGGAALYDRKRALFAPDLVAWVQETQPKVWESLSRSHGSAAESALLDRVRKQIADRGTLDVIRHGVEMVGVRGMISLAQFKPAMGMNPDIIAAYQANRLRVVRQLRYSVTNENCFDLALFLNGIPVATAELKTDFTQSITDAIDQYRFDRLPRPKGGNSEPLLTFPSGALVHFAVSNSEVHMTTKLAGPTTRFLPFNKGDAGGAGNPLNEHGHRTAYLWEEIWERESWLEIIGRYLVAQRDAKRAITGIIFPAITSLMPLESCAQPCVARGQAANT